MNDDLDRPLLDRLLAAGLLLPMGADGLYGKNAVFEDLVDAMQSLVLRHAADDGAERLRFPPGLSRDNFERSGYLANFPHFAGTVHCFCGDDRAQRRLLACVDAGEDWTAGQRGSDIVLTPAVCYPLYPLLAARGPLPRGGHLADLQGWCFRREPSKEPTRLQMFRQHEWVRVGSPDQVLASREAWIDRARELIGSLALPFEVEVANDPFFGRAGSLMASSQREQQHKFELVVPVNDGLGPTACVSFNYHLDKFGDTFGIRLHDGGVAHSACVGFGLERIAVAMFRHHGLDPRAWPTSLRAVLWPN